MCVIGKSNSSNSNLSLQQRYDLDFRQFNLSTCQCPYCHTVGRMSPHHTYHRWVLASADTPSVHLRVTVLHCECKTCKHPYHAFLPDWICPFCSFTYTFLLQILGFFYGQGNQHLQTTAKHFGLSRTTIRILIKRFSLEEWRILQTKLAQESKGSSRLLALKLSESSSTFKSFFEDFFHVHSEPFFTRHFPPHSKWSFLCYRLC